ncbi:MAG: ABC transporter substrate binding protein [Candidatus Zixiibacteriota bacterium]
MLRHLTMLGLLILALTATVSTAAETKHSFNLGYFEAGPNPEHSLLRTEFYNQLSQLLPDGYQYVRIPNGFRSAEWNRDDCKRMARELVREKDVDILIAMGPWVVNDLIEAGYDRPILAIHQFNPRYEGLLDENGRPVIDNLTVHEQPGKMFDDLRVLTGLVDVKRLGFLFFPSAGEQEKVLAELTAIGEKLGFEVITADEYDNYGVFAYFKSFHSLPKDIDAIYIGPSANLKTENISSFLQLPINDGTPLFAYEGKVVLEKGAFATASYFTALSEARFNADKAVRIMTGEKPADLPVAFRGAMGLAVNNEVALQCGIHLPEAVLSDFFVVEAKPAEDAPYFTLADAVNRAAMQNPGYLAQYDALEAAVQTAGQARAEYMPQIYGTAGLLYVDNNTADNYRDLISNDQYYASLNLEQKIVSLETLKSIKVAAQERELENINLTKAQLDLELAVSLAYLEYLRAQETFTTCVNNRTLIEHSLELATSKSRMGDGDSLDVVRLEDERYQATIRVVDARAEVRVARAILNSLFNLPGDRDLVLESARFSEEALWAYEGEFQDLLKDLPSQEQFKQSMVAQALSENPAVKSFDTRINIQKQLLSKNSARFYPTLGFKASLNFSDWLEDTPLFEENNTTWSVGGFLNIPLFLGKERLRERGKLKANLSEMEYRRDDTSLKIMRDIHTQVNKLIAADNHMVPAYQSKKRATQLLSIVVPEYSSGKRTLWNLLDAQSNSLRAELNAINARFAYWEAIARLVHAAGWTAHDDYTDFQDQFGLHHSN